MANNQKIIEMYRTKYTTIWNTALQQDTSIILPFVTVQPGCAGQSMELPFFGTTKMKERKQRLEKVEWSEMDFGKRHMKPRQFSDFIPMSSDDKMFMDSLDVTAAMIIEEQRKAAARTRDEVILGVMEDESSGYRVRLQSDGTVGGILGANYTGNDGATMEYLDTADDSFGVIPVNFAARGTKVNAGMLLDKLAELKRRLEEINAWREGNGDNLCVAITPTQKMEMVLWEQSMNKNYGFQSLVTGKLNDFLGITFMVTNMLPKDAAGNRICPAWIKSRVRYGAWEDAKFRIDARTDYVDVSNQIGVTGAWGASRLDKKTTIKIICSENLASTPVVAETDGK